MVTVNTNDLQFILQQIKIAEADARGEPILGTLVPTSELPWGLRHVDGSNNNLEPGKGSYGAAGQEFPRATTASWVNEGDDAMRFGPPILGTDGLPVDFGFPGVPAGYLPLGNGRGPGGSDLPATYLNNNDYAAQMANNPAFGARSVQPGDVVDADPRIISNLIVDQTMNNPAVLITAFQVAGHPDPYTAAGLIQNLYSSYKAEVAANNVVEADVLKTAILTELDQAGLPYEASLNGDLAKLTIAVPNVAPDEGLSAPYNSWMTFFGQFFSHGLDLVQKGGNGSVYIPLQPDDPLYNPASPNTNFMVITRATQNANGETTNLVTPFVDQNQTYTSHPSHQVFLREYALVDGKPVPTGRLLNGNELSGGGMATWADVKDQARLMLGIELNDMNVHSVPLLATDPYGNFIPGENGLPQIIKMVNGVQTKIEGNLALPVDTIGAVSAGVAFLDDIAHSANPGFVDPDRGGPLGLVAKTPDADDVPNSVLTPNGAGVVTTYDNELLDAHYIAGDGRANENIGLTTVHHVFHSEHNRQVELMKSILINDAKAILLETGDVVAATAFLNEWLATPFDTAADLAAATIESLAWNGARMFQSAKFVTEMQYQHLVFEEFARKVQPFVNVFVQYDGVLDPAIVSEFAHTVYRFGHSMLNETVDRYDANFNAEHIDLISAFLNPVEFANSGVDADAAAGAIVRGMTRQRGNEIDEFVTEALRNNLVGLPLDLAAINIARGRETGIPSLNEARAQFFAGSADSQIKPYTSWFDFAMNLKHPVSIINFIASYGTHQSIVDAQTVEAKRDAACKLVFADPTSPSDRLDFLHGTGEFAGGDLGGLNNVDFWVGGLAEKKMVFGGMLGSTFNFVFEVQLEALQDADRFYYLTRLANLNLTAQMENNKFSDIIHRNTDATHLPGDVFSTPDFFIEADQSKQFNAGLGGLDPTEGGDLILSAMMPKVIRVDANGDGISESVRFVGAEHVVMGGTNGNDILIGGKGDDTFWGDAGNDRMEGGEGNDFFFGGDGDDIITDEFGDDEVRSGAGDDVVTAGQGINLIITDTGSDFVVGGADTDDLLLGQDNDFGRGSVGGGMIMGGEGNDWLESGGSNNLILGDNGDLVQGLPIKRSVDSPIIGHDVLVGGPGNDDFDAETGDDIMISGAGTNKFFGQLGFDWASHANTPEGVTADMLNRLFAPPAVAASPATVLDRYSQTEALSGSAHADVLNGDEQADLTVDHALLDRNVSLINGMDAFLAGVDEAGEIRFSSGNMILGGGGSDVINGRGGNDLIDGDHFINAKIRVTPENGATPYLVSGMSEIQAKLFTGEIKPRELSIWREVADGSAAADVDVAEYSGKLADYTIEGFDSLTGVATDLDGDGWISITDTRAAATDGVDLVKNVERALFADGTVKIALHDNRIADGRVALTADGQASVDGQPVGVAGQVLRASMATVTDRDNRSADNLTGTIGNGVEYRWQVETAAGSGEFVDILRIVADNFTPVTGQSYTVSAAEAGLAIRAVARFVDAKGAIETVYSNANEGGNPPEPFPATGAPVISDTTPTENQVLTSDTATIADENGLGAFSYQWQSSTNGVDWANIPGANAATYQPGQALVGASLRLEVSFVDGLGFTEVLYSTPTAPVVDSNVAPTGAPVISDTTPTENQVLTANVTSIADANGLGAFSYQWQSSTNGVDWANIPGANAASYQPGQALVGASLRLQVSFTDGEGTLETVLSVPTAAVVDSNVRPTGALTISDTTPQSGQTLFANTLAIQDANGFNPLTTPQTFQWQSSSDGVTWTDIAGATGVSFLAGAAQVGLQLRASVTFTDGEATVETVTSAATRAVGNTINGTNAANTLNGTAGDDVITGRDGNDTISAGAGDDVIVWNTDLPAFGSPDGNDVVDGGTEGTLGDTFQVNGNLLAERFRVYTAEAWSASQPGRTSVAGTEIVITRAAANLIGGGFGTETVIGQLREIEEIVINSVDQVSANNGNGTVDGGTIGGDTVQIFGNFTNTSLNYSTITINGNSGNDTVDISNLDSAHRIVFRSAGGNDTVVGTLRAEDVIEVPAGADPASYSPSANPDGTVTMSNGSHSVTFTGTIDALPTLSPEGSFPHDGDAAGGGTGGGVTPALLTARDAAGL
ncbi:MAG: heme peroxidase, partial [Rhodobacteraceae bacterium]|nr:heme peroxidase [Paracoccaceae bacterium]